MEDVATEAYRYDDLPTGLIRILHLLPGSDDDPLQCTLQTSSMSDTHYEAISYVWGCGIKNRSIICDGKPLPITANLCNALRLLRSNTTRTLWADSICIDQDNYQEKGVQVAMMGQVYRSAMRVLIVIGDNDLGMGEAAQSLVTEISTMVRKTLPECGTATGSFPWPEEDAPIVSDARWPSFNLFLSQDWFRRGWVVQEAALAKEARLVLGKTELDWADFILTCTWQMLRFPVRQDWIDKVSLHFSLYTYYNPGVLRAFRRGEIKESHISILAASEGLQFLDPRDRIFAFGEVAKDLPGYVSVQPNYEVSYLTVYKQFAMEYMRQNKSAELLEYAGHTGTSLEDDLPSWVPRWDLLIPSPGYTRVLFPSPLTSRDGSLQEPHVDHQSHLHVRGVLLGTVAYASRFVWNNGKDIVDLALNLLKHIQNSETETAYPREKLIDVLLSNFTSGIYFGPWLRFRRDRAALALHLLERLGCTDDEELERRRKVATGGDLRAMVKRISNVIPRMTLVLTTRGHMGLVPDIVQEGDVCAIIFGMNRPSILRPAEDSERHRFLGVGTVMGRAYHGDAEDFENSLVLGDEGYKEWINWDVEEQDIVLC